MCKRCEEKPVIELFNKKYCKSCFFKYFERKVYRTITLNKLIKKDDVVGIAVSGGKDSLTLLYLLYKFSPKLRCKLKVISVDEGIKGYRDLSLEHTKKLCDQLGIDLEIYSYEELFGKTLDKIMEKKFHSCSVCGVLRRNALNINARKLGFTKLATGHNLDDEAQTLLMNQFRSNIEVSARLGPITGIKDDEKLVRRIKPLYYLTEKEVMTYAFLKKLLPEFKECPYQKDSYRNAVRDFLNEFEKKYPGTKHSIVNSFIEILPILKENFSKSSIGRCRKCGEPTSKDICQACITVEKINS